MFSFSLSPGNHANGCQPREGEEAAIMSLLCLRATLYVRRSWSGATCKRNPVLGRTYSTISHKCLRNHYLASGTERLRGKATQTHSVVGVYCNLMNMTGQREHNSVQYRKRWAGADKTKRHDPRSELDWEVSGGACPSPPPPLCLQM